MKILYDHQIFLIQKYGGISKYFCELIKNLPNGNQYQLAVLFSDNQHLKDDHKYLKKTKIPIADREFMGKSYLKNSLYNINKLYSEYIIERNKYDLLHPTYYDPYFLNSLKKPYVITVHDLIDFKFKKLYEHNKQMPEIEKVIRNANRIISISDNTKKDIIDIFNIDPAKIDVIYHGFNVTNRKKTINRFGRYILFVGGRWKYKNFMTFIRAVSSILNKETDLKLVCVGAPFTKAEIEELRNLKILEKTIILGADENTLNTLYSNAQVFVYPTLYEGFGMPILEAFANNCPVCLSHTSSLPEVAGNAGVYFDPIEPESISTAIKKVIYNSEFSKEIVEAGELRLTNFSWEKCANQTSDSYKKAIG